MTISFRPMSLVLEGGGMRGLFTAGVLDCFLSQNLTFSHVFGISAGACHAASFLSGQKGRNLAVNTSFLDNWRYMSLRSLLLTRSYFGMDFMFDEIPNRLIPFDYESFFASEAVFQIGTTDCQTGKARFFDKEALERNMTILRASCSLPLISPIVRFREYKLLDGGIADPIPVRRALEVGPDRAVIVLTRNREYRKEGLSKAEWALMKVAYKKYPALLSTLSRRHETYNDTLEFIEGLEESGQAIVIRPTRPLDVDRYEKDPKKLCALYQAGYEDAHAMLETIRSFI